MLTVPPNILLWQMAYPDNNDHLLSSAIETLPRLSSKEKMSHLRRAHENPP
jgi:hypothetical protein